MNLLEAIHEIGVQLDEDAFVVGGFVRNSLLGLPNKDIDIVTTSNSLDCAEIFHRKLGGTLFPVDPSRAIFRLTLQNSDELGISQLDFSQADKGISWDLEQRDFTIDAMAIPFQQSPSPPSNWEVLDPTGGLDDLNQRSIRMTHPNVFRADPIRVLRATRLASHLKFNIEPETYRMTQRDSFLLAKSSPERIREEFLGILSQPNLEKSLGDLNENSALETVIPELSECKGITQPIEHYWDVYEHSLQTAVMVETILNPRYRKDDEIGKAIPWHSWLDEYFAETACDGYNRATLLKLAGLLHDVAKPETKSIEPNGKVRFLGHSLIGAEKSGEILSRLRFSNRGITMIQTMIEHHLRPSQISQKDQIPTKKAIYRFFRDVGDVALDTIYLSLADFLAARGPNLSREAWLFNSKRIDHTINEGTRIRQLETEPKLLNGHEISRIFEVQPSPELGELILQVREAQATGAINTKQEAVKLVADLLKGQRGTREFSTLGTQN